MEKNQNVGTKSAFTHLFYFILKTIVENRFFILKTVSENTFFLK